MSNLTPEFVYLKNLPLGKRITWIILITAVGFALQFVVSPFIGWLFVLIAALLGVGVGRTNHPDAMWDDAKWENVTIEELERTQRLLNNTTQLRNRYSEFSNSGCFVGFLGFIITILLFVFADGASFGQLTQPVIRGGLLSVPFAVDVLTFALVIWAYGRISIWEPPDLRIKLEQISKIIVKSKSLPQLDIQPSLQLAKTGNGMIPKDCKLLIKQIDAPPEFIGIQVQTSFNDVQGKKYPYTYCVILVKPEFNLAGKSGVIENPPPGGFVKGFLGFLADANQKRESQFSRFNRSLIELKQENDVEIAVVRQDTAPAKGYTTTPVQALEVFSNTYNLVRSMLEK